MAGILARRLHDVVHDDKKLYLVFEYLDLDLKKHMDTSPHISQDRMLIKVSPAQPLQSMCRQPMRDACGLVLCFPGSQAVLCASLVMPTSKSRRLGSKILCVLVTL